MRFFRVDGSVLKHNADYTTKINVRYVRDGDTPDNHDNQFMNSLHGSIRQ